MNEDDRRQIGFLTGGRCTWCSRVPATVANAPTGGLRDSIRCAPTPAGAEKGGREGDDQAERGEETGACVG